MNFIMILNREVQMGKVINALAHMTLGLGYHLKGMPNVNVFFGDSKQIRAFRTLYHKKVEAFSDFPHTMSGGDTPKQLRIGESTFETDMTYYGACLVTEKIPTDLAMLMQSWSQLENYEPYISQEKAEFSTVHQQNHEGKEHKKDNEKPSENKKTIMLVNHKIPLCKTINEMVLASLNIGQTAKLHELRLLNVMDKDGNAHSDISFHPYIILQPKSKKSKDLSLLSAQFNMLLEPVETSNGTDICFKIIRDKDNMLLASVIFGDADKVSSLIKKGDTRLYSPGKKNKFVHAPQILPTESPKEQEEQEEQKLSKVPNDDEPETKQSTNDNSNENVSPRLSKDLNVDPNLSKAMRTLDEILELLEEKSEHNTVKDLNLKQPQ